MITFYDLKLTERSWSVMVPDWMFDAYNGTCVVSLMADNMVGLQSGAYFEVAWKAFL
jgi:hypothetical protein